MDYNDKQLQILSTAEKLFSNQGYDGASVRDIADEAGVNIAMISYYFGSKEKLMQAIFEQRTSKLSEKIDMLLKNENLSPFEKIEVVIEDYVEKVVSKERFYKLMICEQMMEKNTFVITLLNELKRKNTELIDKLIKDGEQKKAFKKGTDTVLLINTMVGTIMQSYISRSYYRTYNNLQHLPDQEFNELLIKILSKHIKELFKALLDYDGK